MAAMFTRMAEEASMVAEHREEQEARDADPDSIDTEKMLTEKAAKGQGEEGEGAAPKPQEDDGGNDEEFQKLQVSSQAQSTAAAASTAAKSRAASAGSPSLTFPFSPCCLPCTQLNFMEMQYDDLFDNLESREADLTLLLLRASWLRQHHQVEDMESLIPKKGVALPQDAVVSATELRSLFNAASGNRGYRKVDMPFITLAQFWKAREHPDPEEEVLQGVISYLQQRWEEVSKRTGCMQNIS